MKNVISVDAATNTWLSTDNISDGTNTIFADILVGEAVEPQLKVYLNDELVYTAELIAHSDNLIDISAYIPETTGALSFQYVDNAHTGSTFVIIFDDDRDGDLNIARLETRGNNFVANYYQPGDITTRLSAVEQDLNILNSDMITYETATKNMQALMSMGFGMYTSSVQQPDGSYINYMHDAETIADSSVVWKLTSAGLMVSTDAGSTWGVDSIGNALFNILTVHGINADWIHSNSISIGKLTSDVQSILSESMVNVDVMYALSDSNTIAPTSGWNTKAPAWVDGKYMWQKTVVTNGDGTVTESNATCITGATGAKGDAGIGVSSIVEQYYLSTSSTTQTGGSWSTSQPTWSSGKYIWTRSYITWTNGTTSTTNPVLANAINGANSTANAASSTASSASSIANTINEVIAQWCYNNNTTYINGAKIYTGSIKAKSIDVDDVFAQDITAKGSITGAKLYGTYGEITSGSIGGFTLTDKLTATGTAYLPPTLSDFNTIKNAMANGTIGSLYSQNIWWDINGDGKTDAYDFGYMRNMILGKSEYKDYAHKKLSNVTIEISPNSTDKSIRIYGTNAWGSLVETYIGIDEVATNSIKANSYIAVGGDTWNDDGIKTVGDVIAGLGTSNQVSLLSLYDKINDTISLVTNIKLMNAIPQDYNNNGTIVSVEINEPGVYLVIAYNHNQKSLPIWLNGETSQDNVGYAKLAHDSCLSKILAIHEQQTLSLMNLNGQILKVNGSTYIGAIRLRNI